MSIHQLPDELFYTAFKYLDPTELSRASRTDRRWHGIANGPYFNEYYKDSIRYEKVMCVMMEDNINDVDYLVGLMTPVLKSGGISKVTWTLYVTVVVKSIYCLGKKFASSAFCDFLGMNKAYSVSTGANARSAISDDAGRTHWPGNGYEKWLHAHLRCITIPNAEYYDDDGNKAHQLAEALILMSSGKHLFRQIQDIVRDKGIPDLITLSQTTLDELKDNPWIKQYNELFPP